MSVEVAPEKLRILLANYRGNPHCGGQGVYIRHLSKALVELGHSVTVVSGQPWPIVDSRVRLVKLPTLNLADASSKLQAFRWHWLKDPTDRYEFFSSLSGEFPDPQCFAQRFWLWLQQHQSDFDVVHDNQTLGYAMLDVQQAMPLVQTVHHPITKDLQLQLEHTPGIFMKLLVKRWYNFLKMQKKVASQMRHVITPSTNSKADIVTELGIDVQAVEVVALGVDTDEFHPISTVDSKPFQIISTVSADAPLKGMQYLLQAAALLRERYPELSLVIAGEPKADSPSNQLISKLQLQDCVQFFKGVSQERFRELYAQSSVAVVPSLYEGFCLPAVEAMACQVPLVVTDVGSIPEVVQDAAKLVPAADPAALAQAIGELFDSPDLRKSLVAKGSKLVNDIYSWQRVAQQHVEKYRQAIVQFDYENN